MIDNTINGKCSRCGECCAEYIPWTQEEVDTVRAYVKEHNIPQQKHLEGDNLHMFCAFKAKGKCLIYPVRPKPCRDFICNQLPEVMNSNKIKNHLNAKYNAIDSKGNLTNLASTDYLFYGDMQYDLQYAYSMLGDIDKALEFLTNIKAAVLEEYK